MCLSEQLKKRKKSKYEYLIVTQWRGIETSRALSSRDSPSDATKDRYPWMRSAYSSRIYMSSIYRWIYIRVAQESMNGSIKFCVCECVLHIVTDKRSRATPLRMSSFARRNKERQVYYSER